MNEAEAEAGKKLTRDAGRFVYAWLRYAGGGWDRPNEAGLIAALVQYARSFPVERGAFWDLFDAASVFLAQLRESESYEDVELSAFGRFHDCFLAAQREVRRG